MKELQALVTGALIGSLLKPGSPLAVHVDVKADGNGNYLPWFEVRGVESGERVRVLVEAVDP